jgi:hypothetical protein
MSGFLDPLTFPTIDVPAIWCPRKEKRLGSTLALSIEEQAKGSLLQSADLVEVVLRLIYGETEIERTFVPPEGYDPEVQGEWDESQVTFAFARKVKKVFEERNEQCLQMEYQVDGSGRFRVEITPESFSIEREY